jgi:fumarate reductase subunit C
MAKPYPRAVSNTWWLKRWPYRIFILRELSALFLAAYVVLLLVLVSKVHDGAKAFEDYLNVLQSPLLIAFHVVALLFMLLHTVTFFQAMPKGLPMRRGEELMPPALMIGGNYVAWLMVTVVVAAIFLV